MATSAKTPYEILGVARGSTSNQLLAAYRTKIHEHLQSKISPVNFRLICRAYETLTDHTRRKQYDSLKKWTSELPIDRYTAQQLAAEPHLIHHLKKRLEQASLKEINGEDLITGHTTLYCAARAGNLEAVQFLIEHRAEPDLSQRPTSTALHVASVYGHASIVRYLLENGGDYRIVNAGDRTAEEEAYGNGVKRVFAELKQHSYVRAAADELDWFKNNGLTEYIDTEYFVQRQTLLHCACKKGYFDMVRWFIEQCSANMDLVDSNGNSPLHLAVSGGHLKIVEYLLDRGCNSTLRNQREITAEEGSKHSRWIADLFESMRERDMFEMAREGVDWWFFYYFDVQSKDTVDSNGISVLSYACHHGHHSIAKWLLEHGANVNIQISTELKSRLLDASIVELLLEYGVDVNVANGQLIPELEIDDKSVHNDQLQELSENVFVVQNYLPVAEYPLNFQQTDTLTISALSCVCYMNLKLVARSLRLFPCQTLSTGTYQQVVTILSEDNTDQRSFNGDGLTLTLSADCIKNDDTFEMTRFNRSDLRRNDIPSTICLLKTMRSNTDEVLLLLLASVTHQSDVRLYMLTIPSSYSFNSNRRSNQRCMLDDIHAFLRHTNIISIHLTSAVDLFTAPTTEHTVTIGNKLLSSRCLTLCEQSTDVLPHIADRITKIDTIQPTRLDNLLFSDTIVPRIKRDNPHSNPDKSHCANAIYPKIPYVMNFTRCNEKSRTIRRRSIKQSNSKAITCSTPTPTNQTQGTPCKSLPHWSSQRLILSPVLKWPPWLALLHRINT